MDHSYFFILEKFLNIEKKLAIYHMGVYNPCERYEGDETYG